MRFRQTALALFTCMALGAVAANTAQGGQWTVGTEENQTSGGTKLASETVACKKHGTNEPFLTSKVLGASLKLTATGADCLSATIDTTPGGVVHSAGTVKLTGVSVIEPKHCSVGGPAHELTTAALTSEMIMDPTAGSSVIFEKVFPESGTTIITMTFEGAECPIGEATVSVKGTLCGEAVHTNAGGTGFEPNKTGTLTVVHTELFGSAQQTTGGCHVTEGTDTVQVSGVGDSWGTGPSAGKPYGAD